MRNQLALESYQNSISMRLANFRPSLPRRAIVGVILMVALFAFEIFNFDTTRYALSNLMGDVQFLGFKWAAILGIAFCSIDFAGLVRLFTPEKGRDEPKEVWYLTGAWLLGATMNALMTWWAVSLTLLDHEFGNEVLSREQLLNIVPFFVAVLVWLTRILFIGAFSVAGEHIFDFKGKAKESPAKTAQPQKSQHSQKPASAAAPVMAARPVRAARQEMPRTSSAVPQFLDKSAPAREPASQPVLNLPQERTAPARSQQQGNSRVQRRPPMPGAARRVPYGGVQARSRTRN